jgi:hypothetical protein
VRAHFDDGGAVRRVVDQRDLGRRRRRGRPRRPGPALKPVFDVEPALEHPPQVRGDELGVRRVTVLRNDAEDRDRRLADRGRVGAADREPVRGEHPGGPPQQAGPVEGDDRDLVAVDDRGGAAAGGQRELVLAQRGGLGHGLAVKHGADPPDEIGDEPGLPVVPRGRAGGEPVGLRQGV